MSSSYSTVLWARGHDRLKFILNIWNTKSVNDRSMKSSSVSMARSWILRMACSSNLNTSSVECMVGSPGTHSQVKFFVFTFFFEKLLWDRIIVESIFSSCLRSWFFGHLLNLSDQRCITGVRPKGPIFLVSKGAMHLLENENHKFNGPWGVLAPITPSPTLYHKLLSLTKSGLVCKISSFHSYLFCGRI